MGWFGFGKKRGRTPPGRAASAKKTPTTRTTVNQPLSRAARLKRIMQLRALREWNAARRERIAKMTPIERAKYFKQLKLYGLSAAALAAIFGAIHFSRTRTQTFQPAVPEIVLTIKGPEIPETPFTSGVRVVVEPTRGERKEDYERRYREAQEELEDMYRDSVREKRPFTIGKFVHIKPEAEIQALKDQEAFEEITGKKFEELNYGIKERPPVPFTENMQTDLEMGNGLNIPKGSLLVVKSIDTATGFSAETYVIYQGDLTDSEGDPQTGQIRYAYPDPNKGPQIQSYYKGKIYNGGYSGNAMNFFTPPTGSTSISVVSGYYPPHP